MTQTAGLIQPHTGSLPARCYVQRGRMHTGEHVSLGMCYPNLDTCSGLMWATARSSSPRPSVAYLGHGIESIGQNLEPGRIASVVSRH